MRFITALLSNLLINHQEMEFINYEMSVQRLEQTLNEYRVCIVLYHIPAPVKCFRRRVNK
jgi:hypothetical protein